MAKYIQVVGTNCTDPAREKEFNEWYDKTHLPDVLETPGFVRATRYEHNSPKEGDAKYLAVYEIETDDLAAFQKASGENIAKKREAGRFIDCLGIVSAALYKQTYLYEK